MYELYLERAAERDLKSVSAQHFYRLIHSIRALAKNPRPHGSRKIFGSKTDWRIRVGQYRIVYEIDERAKAVRVMRVKHRREAYR